LDEARVAIVVRPLDRALAALRVGLIPAIALALSLPAITSLVGSVEHNPKNWILGVLGPGLALAYLLLLQTESVGARVDRALAQLRRRVALACNHDYASERHEGGSIACWLTPEVFQSPVFRYDQQQTIISKLQKACGEDQPGEYWFVEGRSGSGKTRTALLLVQTLARDPRLCELAGRCYLYDFSDSEDTQEELLRGFATSRHDGAVVLVDNFQLVRPLVLSALTDRLVDRQSSISQRLLVFLSRPRDAWNLSPGSDVRLLSQAKAESRYVELIGPRSDAIARGVSSFDPRAQGLVRGLQETNLASAAQLHLAQVIARNRSIPPDVLGTLQLLDTDSDSAPTPQLAHLLGILVALSMHRGMFSRRELLHGLGAAHQAHDTRSHYLQTLGVYAGFRRLHKIGLVPKIHLDGTRFIFHEAIAELGIDRLAGDPTFARSFHAVGRLRLERQIQDGDMLGAWLISVEVDDQEAAQRTFDAALSRGAYARMLQCLRRARDRYDLLGTTRLQLAILLDRVGDFAESRAEFADKDVAELASSSELAVILAATRLEANHYHDYKADLNVLRGHPDRLVAIIGAYWAAHIEMHHGRFAPGLLLDFATEALGLLGDHHSYWQVHSLARIHFDSLRSQYLSGDLEVATLESPPRRMLNDYLRSRVPTYEALHTLYTQAHLVGHVFLPRLALFDEPVLPDDAALAGLELDETRTIPDLVSAAQRLYRRAHDGFWQYGDREANYLQADIVNAEMVQTGANLDELVVSLRQYERFIAGDERSELASYPLLYFFRWHVLKYYDVLLDPGTADHSEADEHLGKAKKCLQQITSLDGTGRNRYGLGRAQLLSMLLRGIKEPLVSSELAVLHDRMAKHGYRFEQRLISHLAETQPVSPGQLHTILRFYPLVHQ
jgi:hypothetical protein